jgi:hypothetical protein
MPDSADEYLIQQLRDDFRDCQYDRDAALQRAVDAERKIDDQYYVIQQLESRLKDEQYYRQEAERRAERAEENTRGW